MPSMKELERDAHRIFDRSLRLLPGVELNEADQLALLTELVTFLTASSPSPKYRVMAPVTSFDNGWYLARMDCSRTR